ncbi:MAG: amino acid permease [Spirochaetales bacterium]|nr:amino acid permease [Spirochaetales bacterium]
MKKNSKKLGWIALFSLASGTMISSGIFILPGLAYARTGPLVFVAYLAASAAAFLSSLAIVELSTALPKAGGDYYFITRSLGPAIGTIMGLLSWLALMLKTAFAIYGLSELVFLLTGIPVWVSALLFTFFFVVLNLVGTGEAVILEIILVIGLLLIMLVFVLAGLGKLNPAFFYSTNQNIIPNRPGIRQILASAGFIFVSFGGLLNISTMAEEAKNPGKTIPRALLGSVISVGVLYAAMVLVTTGTLKPELFANSLTPIADAAGQFLGKAGLYGIMAASALAFATTGNAGIMAASRYPLALSRDSLLPPFLARHNRRNVPVPAVIMTGCGIAVSVLFPLSTLVKLASTVILFSYMAVNIAVLILRESKIHNYKPLFRIPGYPVVPLISLLLMGFFLAELGPGSMEVLLVFSVCGLMLYLFFGRKRIKYEYAALHLIRNAVNSRLRDRGLEHELLEVLRQRDNIAKDLVDELMQSAILIDITHNESIHGAFQMAGSELAKRIGLDSETITNLLEEREKQQSTALSAFISVPHVLIDSVQKTEMVIIRCRKGLFFDDAHNEVKAIFILIGPSDQRNEHIKILAGLAHLFQHRMFMDIWLSDINMKELRDNLVLLDRKRTK